MKHKKHKVTFVRSAVLLACLTAGGGAWAQLHPWTCNDRMYVGRTTGMGTDATGLYTYEMDDWNANQQEGNFNGSIDAGGTVPGKDLNALAYNPRDNYLYAMKRLTVGPNGSGNSDAKGNRIGLYRIGHAGGIPFAVPFSPNNGAPYQNALRVQFVDTAGNAVTSAINGAAASFDRYGNYFMVDGPRNKLYVVQDLHSVAAGSATQPDPAPKKAWQLKFENEAANLPAGYTAGFANIPSGAKIITDFAVRQAESTGTQSVLYGVGDKMDGKWYLYRFRVTQPQEEVSATSGHAAFVSHREITGMNIDGYMASAAMRRDGKLFVYASGGKVFEINVETGAATEVFAAVGAGNSDGASCMTSIQAQDDGSGAAPFATVGNSADATTASVLDNDKVYLQPVALSGVEQNAALETGSWQSAAPPKQGAITLNPDGAVSVAQGTEPGTYTYTYEICARPEITPKNQGCAKAQVVIRVTDKKLIDAVDDAYGVISATGVQTKVVSANDEVAGAHVVLGTNAQLKPTWIKASGSPATDLTFDTSDGSVTVPAGAAPGNYRYTYELCTKGVNPEQCDRADVTLTVPQNLGTPLTIEAADDDFGARAGGETTSDSIFNNDKVGGVAVLPNQNAALKGTWVKQPSSPAGNLTLNPDGTVTVPPGTPVGLYTYTYELCALPGNTLCDTAEVTLNVTSSGGNVTAVPANAPWALLLGTLGIVGVARRMSRRQRG